jgi:hypothetical protein
VEAYLLYELYYPHLHGVTEKDKFPRDTFLSQVFLQTTAFVSNKYYTLLAYEFISLIFIRNHVIDQET